MNDETTAPANRCVQLNLSGQPCGLKAVAGHDRCYIHGLFRALNDGRSTIDIPLLEDVASILYVYSQVARALAQGSMLVSNATGILRCCRGAQRLLEEKHRHQRFEEKKSARQSTERRPPSAATAEAHAMPSHPQPDQPHATVPPNLKNSGRAETPGSAKEDCAVTAAAECPNSPAVGDRCLPETTSAGEPNASPVVEDRRAAASENDPQPWTLEPDRKIIPPPQFADARRKSDDALARLEGDLTMSLLQRGREIRARGGQGRDGVVNKIRETYS